MEPARIGVVGLGNMGARYVRIVAESPWMVLVGVADTDARLSAETGGRYQTHSYTSVDEMLQSELGIEALIIATPDGDHTGPAVAGARAGKHLFIEKPLADSMEDGRLILEEVNRAGVVLLVGHTLRFDPRFSAVRDAVTGGRIGEVVHLSTRRNTTVSLARRYGPRVSIAMFLGVHDVDFLLWTLQRPVVEAYAVSRRGHLESMGIPLDDTTFSILRFEGGVLAGLENSWCGSEWPARKFNQTVEVVGTKGEIHLIADDTGLLIRGEGFADHPHGLYAPIVDGKAGGVYQKEIEHFVECFRTGRPPLAPGSEALEAVRVILAIHRSLETGSSAQVSSIT
jgi:predicted dehydrogenase